MCVPALIAALPAMGAGGAAAAGTTAAAAGTAAAGTAAAGTAAAGAAATAGTAAATTAAAGMTTAQMISLGLSAASAGVGAISAYSQSQNAKAVAANNARTAEMQAQDAERRGEKEAMELQRRVAATKSAQRVALAAKGLDLGYGTAADLQDQTDFFGQSDVATTRNNARKEAWARRGQVANYEAEALSNKPWLSGGSTLLAGAGQVADRWYTAKGR